MSITFAFVESNQHDGVLHWRCEFKRDSGVVWIPVPYDDLFLELGTAKCSTDARRPSSKSAKRAYKKGSVLYGTRMPLNEYVGLHKSTNDKLGHYVAANAGVNSLSAYVKNTDRLLAVNYKTIGTTARVSDRTLRRRINSITGLSKNKLTTLFSLHDFLSTACGYGGNEVTLTNSINPVDFYDQPHFTKKFLRVFGCNPTEFFKEFNGLPEQLLTVSYKYMPDFHVNMSKLLDKEI